MWTHTEVNKIGFTKINKIFFSAIKLNFTAKSIIRETTIK